MRRRLRKKKRLGEFTEFGFSVRAELTPGVDDSGIEAFVDRWIDAVEARGLGFGGGGGEIFEGFVVRMGRGSATEPDREALSTFLAHDSVVLRHEVGMLIDAWNAPDEGYRL